jgi:hypothetical protein
MRLVGPGSMGILNTDPAVSLDATAGGAPRRRVGWDCWRRAARSDRAARALRAARHRPLELRLGRQQADVSGNDLLAYWAEDPRTTAVLLYLESFGNPRKFAQLAPTVAREKPIVAVAARYTAPGRTSASTPSSSRPA